MIKNPILPGFYPDPSIIRVKDDFYIVNSSFEYFPAIPIWHSKDLIHWKQIANAVTDQSQGLDLSNVECSQGVQAVTIRYHRDKYYLTSTRIQNKWPSDNYHFIMEADHPIGPWSKVHYIKDAYGIDSSLFFDDDKAYFIANREKEHKDDGGDTEIWIQEIDLNTFTLVGEKHSLWDGTGGIFPEGPHIYKRNGYYYLLVAEGGTLHNHTVTIARSNHIFGPYVSSVRNPILTHKHLDRTYPIQNVGHADIVELQDGSWYGVCLGSRPRGGFYDGGNMKYSFGGYYRNLGRETYLFPVKWPNDDISPLFSPSTGKIEFEYDVPTLKPFPQEDYQINFKEEDFKVKWCSIKKENRDNVKINDNKLHLTLLDTLEETFIGFRQDSWTFSFVVSLDVSNLKEEDIVGVSSYMTKHSNISLMLSKTNAKFISTYKDEPEVMSDTSIKDDKVIIEVQGNDQDYLFRLKNTKDEVIDEYTFDGRIISCDMNDTHTGAFIGLFGKSKKNTTIKFSNMSYCR